MARETSKHETTSRQIDGEWRQVLSFQDGESVRMTGCRRLVEVLPIVGCVQLTPETAFQPTALPRAGKGRGDPGEDAEVPRVAEIRNVEMRLPTAA